MTWKVDERGSDVVALPVADLVLHDDEVGSICACGPVVEEVVPGRFLYTHHALDGRK